ncbi:hypothetical protein EOA60_21140 [Mesorhizobium sp. M1A.F.Ca.IN.020.06.1.1]|uniref:hypothetical protein n=1 Tax=unclassified Mesorhizobium TaxID=325217 RepID=UPI000FCB11C1|nr:MULTISPECIES: hypothetical protein [unclassified Mesorhizobium]RUV90269.1 hypothetical protein EOA51_00700 [Mesorhizobium sp. M1A.F.Ca.IN.020.32.1.1]RUW12745.1 hypothetical protein EOA46_08540 [Mesorhizobium sp. M1A.F.Ca.IN.022.05.2.1]RUW24090.1 hypothetical protein EOA60_21140 [Mesorhizobium sp. M1A.F.Ca.IN.020.06.1.1]RWF82254.1 MAG: hypothetical protein EOQ35_10825 [Mesorhizobium sp.]RWG02638.1 MAG: hypothetical protein EOQ38_09820 [Mesorhizobium sp.]
MKAPTDDLNDLESDIGNLAHLMGVLTEILVEMPRVAPSAPMLDRANALSWIARDMANQMVEAVALCHARVLADRRSKKGGSLQ